jgi:phosphatidylglycerol:prolipoprotein diacylglycerol transferase
MFVQPAIDPVALSLGPLQVRWYGLMYLLGFIAGWALGRYRAARPASSWTGQQVDDLLFYIALGIVVGGRVGYVLFYNLDALLQNPLLLFKVWEGGMSFHGGFLGVLIAMVLFARKVNRPFFVVTDFIAPLIPPGLLFGRIGNFINGELWGRVTDLPWAVVFHSPGAGALPRHPSQLYEAVLEGIALFVILWLYSAKPRPTMAVSGLFLLCYGLFRFGVEFVREPDAHMGFIAAGWLTMGQLLSLPMIPIGIAFIGWAYRGWAQRDTNKS